MVLPGLQTLLERRSRDVHLRQSVPRTLGLRGPHEECLDPIPVERPAFVPGEKAVDRAAQIRRLHRELDRHAGDRISRAQQADIIRLLLTGCRKSEIVTMRWQDVDADTLNLTDAKTGPRRVFLNAPARAILKRQPRTGSAYVFPSPWNPECC